MKYKIGNMVRIKKGLVVDKSYGGVIYLSSMERYFQDKDYVIKITAKHEDIDTIYRYDDKNSHWICDDMIEGLDKSILKEVQYNGFSNSSFIMSGHYKVIEESTDHYRVIDRNGNNVQIPKGSFKEIEKKDNKKVYVKCIDPIDRITKGKVYEVIREDGRYYTVIDDKGHALDYRTNRFIKISKEEAEIENIDLEQKKEGNIMYVKCKQSLGYALTVGKIYEVVYKDYVDYQIIDDTGDEICLPHKFFEEVKETENINNKQQGEDKDTIYLKCINPASGVLTQDKIYKSIQSNNDFYSILCDDDRKRDCCQSRFEIVNQQQINNQQQGEDVMNFDKLLNQLTTDTKQVGAEVLAGELANKITLAAEKVSGHKLTLLENLPFVGNVKGVALPLLGMLAALLFPNNKYASKANAVCRYAYRGNLNPIFMPIAGKAGDFLAELAGLYDSLPEDAK